MMIKDSYHILRGGSWLFNVSRCEVSYRYSVNPNFRYYDLGFRMCIGGEI